ncbi:MAG: hypothetical protein IJT71_03240, partial [Oscillospiraceae bacterium]|nr:hypothetical protein [Oscillospiraceae bacterium]
MVNWKYVLLAQYPACFLLAVSFLFGYLRSRKRSAVRSILWVLLFAAAIAAAVLFAFLGAHEGYWTVKTLFRFGAASWIGVALALAAGVARLIHVMERRRGRKTMERELEKAAREKDDAVAQAREDGRRAAQEEAEAVRLAR